MCRRRGLGGLIYVRASGSRSLDGWAAYHTQQGQRIILTLLWEELGATFRCLLRGVFSIRQILTFTKKRCGRLPFNFQPPSIDQQCSRLNPHLPQLARTGGVLSLGLMLRCFLCVAKYLNLSNITRCVYLRLPPYEQNSALHG